MKKISINMELLGKVWDGEAPATSKVGYSIDEDGKFHTVFAAQDKETKAFRTDKNGHALFNCRPQLENRRTDDAATEAAPVETPPVAENAPVETAPATAA